MHVFREGGLAITQTHNNNNNNNNIELYSHDYKNTAFQKRGKQDNYSNLVTRIKSQHLYKSNHNIYPIFQ